MTGITWVPSNCAVRPASFRAESSVKSSSIESWLFNAILVCVFFFFFGGIITRSSVELQKKWEWNDELDLFLDGLDCLTCLCAQWSMYVWSTILPVTNEIKQIFQNLNPEFPHAAHYIISKLSSFQPGIMSASMYLWCGRPQQTNSKPWILPKSTKNLVSLAGDCSGHVDNSVINPDQPLSEAIIHNRLANLWYVTTICWYIVIISSMLNTFICLVYIYVYIYIHTLYMYIFHICSTFFTPKSSLTTLADPNILPSPSVPAKVQDLSIWQLPGS